jgi:hypothetical protein
MTISVFACIDKRFDALLAEFYENNGQNANYYMVTAAGSSLPISYSRIAKEPSLDCFTVENCKLNQTLKGAMTTNLSISESLSSIEQLDIVDHQDCGAFRVFLPCADLNSKENEKIIHAKSLNIASNKLNFTGPIRKLLIDLNGTVGQLEDDNTYTVIYKGPGNNPNGLFFNS